MMDGHDLRANLSQFNNGTGQVYRHGLNPFLYSDGVRFFAQNAGNGAYWLLDIVATQPEIWAGYRKHDGFVIVHLKVVGTVGHLTVARDTKGDDDGWVGVEYVRTIDYTDCPEGEWKFYLENYMMLLPSER